MNIYDTANKLATEIKQSEEYQNFKMAKEVINLNKELKEKIRKFETMRYETQIVQMQTGKQDEEKLKSAKELFSELVQDEVAKKYFDAETKFNILIADVNKIIGESIKDIIKG